MEKFDIKPFIVGLSLFLLMARTALSADMPDLGNQKKWDAKDKKDFIQFLESGKQMPVSGSVKSVAIEPDSPSTSFREGKARYANVSFITSTLVTIGNDNKRHLISSNLGAKVLLGGHMFSWVRYYWGFQYAAIDQKKKNGLNARLNHYEVPFGFELALIPLGTPQTRYVILRGGASFHYIEGNARDNDFDNSILGARISWNAGLGYEWQIAETSWRWNALIEGLRSVSREEGTRFTGAGLTAGVVYTF